MTGTQPVDDPGTSAAAEQSERARGAARKQLLVRLDPRVHDALARWAADDLRSVNAQIEVLLRDALRKAGRLPHDAAPLPARGRPPGETRRRNS